jgi:hypothetical protein
MSVMRVIRNKNKNHHYACRGNIKPVETMGSYLVFCRDENGTFRGCAMTVEATVAALEP